ncbi:anthranilate synthase component I family protein [Puia dinghuensis]|uniref:Anthranilate synthase component 1 n=1 Tax=Puia dinghuensis TaxID=1792502 RepID=A0A8J2UAW2_9BACT|nr:anthranilate synthase component I family protein [Puia dinghuensis]GGA91265.1 anthranilate synthase component I [Puia dinghuensis]
MKKIAIKTHCKKLLSDIYTPVGIYLRLRDRFRDTILLESTDYHAADNSYSFICINAIAGIEITDKKSIEFKLPGQAPERQPLGKLAQDAGGGPAEGQTLANAPKLLWDFMARFEVEPAVEKPVRAVQGLFGYTTFDAVQFFDTVKFSDRGTEKAIPLMRYRLYQYVIAINHFKDELFICENVIAGLESELPVVESLIRSKDVPVYPFEPAGEEVSNMTDEDYRQMVGKGIKSCLRGDVFQIVLSRRFQQGFRGDEFNVYRALRNINPSPYLFFFDYGDYKLMGSSPESQILLQNGEAIVHPIAGTFKRSGDDAVDRQTADRLLKDAKENSEHVMLVDLARNDLSRSCDDVRVVQYRSVQYFSHVIHLVSEVRGKLRPAHNPFALLATTFPAGTLSGAPKFKAMELIDGYEPTARSYYGGCIGFMGFDGSCVHAIMIRSLLSRNNTLTYQAGAGVVAASQPESELQEVNNKLGALKSAIRYAAQL